MVLLCLFVFILFAGVAGLEVCLLFFVCLVGFGRVAWVVSILILVVANIAFK